MVFDGLSKHNSVSLVGDSQTGKSLLLWHVAQQAQSTLGPDHEAVYLDMQLMRKLRGRKVVLCLDEMEKMTWRGFSHDLRSELRGIAEHTSPLDGSRI